MNVIITTKLRMVVGVAVAALLALASRSLAQEPEITVQLERERIFEGDSVQYTVMLRNFDKSAKPNLERFADFDVKMTSSGVSVRQFGRNVTRMLVFKYVLTPNKSGEIEVPSPTAEQDGKVYRGPTAVLVVAAAEEQDIAKLELTVSDDQVYPMQPFDVRLTIAVHPLPDVHEDRSPVAVQDPPPRLTIPWASDSELPAGLRGKVSVERWLTSFHRKREGFAVNNFTASSVFSFNGRLAVFHPKPTRAFRKDSKGRRIEYWEYVFERTFIAERAGEFSFGPVGLKGVFATRTNTRGRLEGEPIYASAKAVAVRVKDVPTEDRPASYTGAVGRFQIGAEITPREAKVGDPMTLVLWLTGVGTLDQTLAPNLEEAADVADGFKIYEATEETENNTRRFTYSVRPKHDGVTEVPPIPISYFDVDEEKFVTLRSEPLAIVVSEADHLAGDDIAMAMAPRSAANDIEISHEGIFANVTDLSQLRDEAVHPQHWFFGLGGLAGLFFVVTLVTQRIQTFRADAGLQRRRAAVGNAKKRLGEGATAIDGGDTQNGIERVSESMLGFVADVCDADAGGLTSQGAVEKLEAAGVGQPVIDRFAATMEACDGARYGAGIESRADLLESAKRSLDELARELKARRLLS